MAAAPGCAGTAPSTVGCRSAGASRSSRGGTAARTAAMRATTGLMRSTCAERRDAPPTHYANWRVQGGLTAVPGATLMAGAPVAANRIAVRSDAAAPLARPPAYKPETPVRPAVRSPGALPPPASTLDVARAPAAPIATRSRGALAPAVPMVYGAGGLPATPSVRGVPPVVAPAAAAQARAPLRIDDGHNVLQPSSSAPTAPPVTERSFRTAPLPARSAPMPVAPAAPRSSRPRRCCRRLIATSTLPHVVAPTGVAPPRTPSSLPTPVPPVRPRRRRLRRRQRPRNPLYRPVRREAFQPARHPPIRDRTTGRTRG